MSIRVLLADPEPTITAMYGRTLSAYGFEVALASTGEDCLEQLRAFRPGVLVLDPELPCGQGEAILARVRAAGNLSRLVVILLCATYRPEHLTGLAGFASWECFQKPVLPYQLANRIQILTGGLSPAPPPADLTGAAPARPDAPSGGARAPGGRLRVLIVDDERDTADSLGLLLQRAGHEVKVAYTGAAALETARQLRPDVVLCDLGLPGLDGLQVAAALRADPATADARLIAVSGYGQQCDASRSRAAGFDLHLTKPVDPEAWPRVLAGE
jgi:CheY-like chemotaxis protein